MTENSSTSTEVINKKHFDIVIIGGGIAGLYCALMYKGYIGLRVNW
jgi:glycerol-3-phosphate dehydrogenase